MRKPQFVMLFLLCLGCATATNRLIEKEKLNFSYTDEAYLFFRNMRQTQYNRVVMEKEGLRLYQYDDFSEGQFFKTQMVINWRMNNAFMLLDLKDSTAKSEIKIYVKSSSGELREIVQENIRRQGELVFLTDLYNAILQEESFLISIKGGKKKPLFETSDDLEAFRVSMYDFYRLTAVL